MAPSHHAICLALAAGLAGCDPKAHDAEPGDAGILDVDAGPEEYGIRAPFGETAHALASPHFVFRWGDEGDLGVDEADVTSLRDALETSLAVEHESMGYPLPLGMPEH